MKCIRLIFFLFIIIPSSVFSQTITYSTPDRDDARSVEFEIIGKVSGNFLIYKNIRNRYDISVFDNEMKVKEKVDLDFMTDKTLNVDFIAFPDFAWLIYQYQKRNILYCMAVKLDGNGKKMSEPVELDTTHIRVFAENKIYSVVNSEDKQKIMIYKIQKKNDKFLFTTLLYDAQLNMLHRSRIETPYNENKESYSDFFLDNEGTFVFAKSVKGGNREMASNLFLFTQAATEHKFNVTELDLKKHYIDEVKLKVDNVNKRYIINSFYYKQKRGNIEGVYTNIWDQQIAMPYATTMIPLADDFRAQAKTKGNGKFAFDDYYIRHVITKKDGGFILAAEDFSSQNRGAARNRYDYLYGSPYFSSYDYYSYSNPYWNYYRPRYFGNTQTRFFYDNIAVMNFDKEGKLVWSKIIHKEQYEDDNDSRLSYQIMNAGGELHFLFNELERRNQLIADQSVTPDGKVTRHPTLKSLDKGYEFMPRFAKQVSAKQIIVPCTYRNYICFAKIEY